MTNNLCISIAVSRPEDLAEVPGAIPSAKRVVAWARAMGYDTELVTDENKNEPVTCSRLQEIFRRKLGQGGQSRLLVSFAGHGLIRGGAEEFWLLNGWKRQPTEAVNHIKLRDRLGTYLPEQLAVISDACRSLPTAEAKWVEGNGIVDITSYVEKPVEVANLAGTRTAQPAFATPLGVEEANCFFTKVLVDALCGIPADVVEHDPVHGQVILNDRLFNTIERELPLLASKYNRNQVPDLQGAWRSPKNIWSILTSTKSKMAPEAEDGPVPSLATRIESRKAQVRRRAHDLEGVRDDQAQSTVADTRVWTFEQSLRQAPRPTHFETRTGVAVTGAAVTQVVVSRNFEVKPDSHPDWYQLIPDERASPILVRLSNGDWLGAAVYEGLIGTFGVGPDGAESYVLRRPRSENREIEHAVARAAAGETLSDPYEAAALLRDNKHDDPVFGALAAYAYSRAGAVEEIRRMTYFYGFYNQPAPFDAILLARVEVRRDRGGYVASIPAVEGRAMRAPAERRRLWTFEATPAVEVQVGGAFPWLRQGWALLEDDFRSPFRKLSKFASNLRPSLFTTLKPEAGEELAQLVSHGEI